MDHLNELELLLHGLQLANLKDVMAVRKPPQIRLGSVIVHVTGARQQSADYNKDKSAWQ